MVKGAKSGKATVSQADFIKAVCTVAKNGGHRKDVAALLGLGEQSVAAREKSYREAGIQLPQLVMGQRGRKVDVEAANKLIAELAKAGKKAAKAEKAEKVAPTEAAAPLAENPAPAGETATENQPAS